MIWLLYSPYDSDGDGDGDEGEHAAPIQYSAVTCTGVQPGSNVFVFGPNFQMSDDGSVIPANEYDFVWVDDILSKLQRPINPLPLLHPIPTNHLRTLISGMRDIAGENVLSGVFLLGTYITIRCD